jgi:histidine triad (HIT) family protein
MNDCLFCRIIKGEIPSSIVYKDNDVIAFLDIFPFSKGHTIVVPVEHYFNLLDFPEEKMERYFSVLKVLSGRIKNALKADGINIIQNNFPAAGQVINHLHFHILPRWDNDGKSFMHQPEMQADAGYLKEVTEKIRAAK